MENENKIINVKNSNFFYKPYETISFDLKNKKKPYVLTNIIKKKGKLLAETVNISRKTMAKILKETPGLFFSLPKETFEDAFLNKSDKLDTDLELFFQNIQDGMLKIVDNVEGSLALIGKDVDEFQAKMLERVDFENDNLTERLAAKEKIKNFNLNL